MSLIQSFFRNNGYVFEILLSAAFFTWGLQLRKRFGVHVLGVLLGMLFVSVLWQFLPADNAWLDSLRTSVFFLLCVLGVLFCFHVNFMQAAFYVTAAGASQHFCFKAARTILMLLWSQGVENEFLLDSVYFVLAVLLEVVCGLFFGKKLRKDNGGMKQGEQKSGSMPTNSPTVLMLLIGMQLSTNLFQNLFDQYDVGIGPYTVFNFFDMICCLFLLMLQCEIARKEKEQESNAIMQHLLYQQKQQMKLSRETIDLINIKCHDIKNQIASIGNHIPEDELADLNRAINIYDTAFKSGNEALDILLMEKFMQCENKKIRLDCMIKGELLSSMKQSDIYSLFGNAIDNAIEAVERISDEEKRCINIRVKESRGMILIHVENHYVGEISFEEGLPQTTKKDKRYHGFGMKSIRMITEKYHGYLSAGSKDGIFSLDILLPMPISKG